MKRALDFLASLKLTIICLSLAFILVFAGTLAQVHYGLNEIQRGFFQSLIVWFPPGSGQIRVPVFPGGHLIGVLLLANLIAAFVGRFQWTWRKAGIQLVHAGLIVMLLGALFTDLFAVESYMRLAPGEIKNFSEDSRRIEVAVIDQTDAAHDRVVSIPESLLRSGRPIISRSLPFSVLVRHFYPNASLASLNGMASGAKPAATQGVGAMVSATERPPATAQDEVNSPAVVLEIVPGAGAEPQSGQTGTWLLSEQLGAPQTFTYGGRTWRLVLRQARYYKPYSLTLKKFTHEVYPGTDKPRNFASSATLKDTETGEERDVLIYMNHPLRYRGDTYYQSGFEQNDAATILQVVHNPSIAAPYLACALVSLGLLIQFGYHFVGFIRRRNQAATS